MNLPFLADNRDVRHNIISTDNFENEDLTHIKQNTCDINRVIWYLGKKKKARLNHGAIIKSFYLLHCTN